MTNYKDWIKDLGLLPHPEGGYYKETYLHPETLFTQKGERSLSSSCLFLLTAFFFNAIGNSASKSSYTASIPFFPTLSMLKYLFSITWLSSNS